MRGVDGVSRSTEAPDLFSCRSTDGGRLGIVLQKPESSKGRGTEAEHQCFTRAPNVSCFHSMAYLQTPVELSGYVLFAKLGTFQAHPVS